MAEKLVGHYNKNKKQQHIKSTAKLHQTLALILYKYLDKIPRKCNVCDKEKQVIDPVVIKTIF